MKPAIFINQCRIIGFLFVCVMAGSTLAAIEVYQFDSDVDKARFQRLSDELRCPMCKNTNLSGSDALIANNLRKEIYRMITEGKNDGEIIEFMTSRYGDFVLYRPPLEPKTYVIWFGPLLLLIAALVILWRIARKQRLQADNDRQNLDENEQEQLKQLLSENPGKGKS